MRLKHYTSKSVLKPRIFVQQDAGAYKPKGMWVSDEDAEQPWSKWTRDEDFCNVDAQYEHDVALATDHNVLILSTAVALQRFTQRYKEPWASEAPRKSPDEWAAISWHRVAQQYHGIIITPYQWSQRYDFMWYYGWDCASGCIWHKDAVASIVMSRPPVADAHHFDLSEIA